MPLQRSDITSYASNPGLPYPPGRHLPGGGAVLGDHPEEAAKPPPQRVVEPKPRQDPPALQP